VTVLYARLADLVLVVHGLFVLFVVLGGLLVLRWPRLAWIHLPVAVWGVLVEFASIVCPLTPLENALRRRAGQGGYSGGFIEHYVTAALYPDGLTRGTQIALGILVLGFNAFVYRRVLSRRRR
jgi:hypothetical protein